MTRKELSSFMSAVTAGRHVIYRGDRLDEVQSRNIRSAYALFSLFIFDTLRSFSPTSHFDPKKFYEAILLTDFYEMCLFYKEVDNVWKNTYFLPDDIDFLGLFKGVRPYWSSSKLKIWLKPITMAFETRLEMDLDDTSLAYMLNQFCNFITRINVKHDSTRSDALSSYRKVQEELNCAASDVDIALVKSILTDWLQGFCVADFPNHGPGSVSAKGIKSRSEKYGDLELTPRIRILLNRHPEWEFLFPLASCTKSTRSARIVFAPKTVTSYRTISAEPAECQFVQQAVKDSLYRFIGNHPFLSRMIPLDDQSCNQRLARLGSRTGKISTIDLSAASDTVSWELVKLVFRDTPLYPYLTLTRSNGVELPDGEVLYPKFFAPMGSALCFPIECLVFGAITVANVPRSRWRECSVYGDDIIVPTEFSDHLVAKLTTFGFRVNKSKSFTDPGYPFRESCGGEYYKGVDITPMRLPRKFSWALRRVDIKDFAGYISEFTEMANRFVYSAPRVREVIIRHLLQVFPDSVVFGQNYLYSVNPTNFHLRTAEGKEYKHGYADDHRKVIRTFKSVPLQPTDLEEVIRLLDWYRTRHGTSEPVVSVVTRTRFEAGTSLVASSMLL